MGGAGGSAPLSTSSPVAPRLAYDVARLALALSAGVVAGLVLLVAQLVAAAAPPVSQLAVQELLIVTAVSSVFYVSLTWAVLKAASPAQLRVWLEATRPRTRLARWGATLSGTGPAVAMQWSVLATAAVLVFLVWPELLSDSVTMVLCVVVVATAWIVTVMAYAVHYARFDQLTGAFAFPDQTPRVFMDYVYLAVQVQSTFGTSDVSVTDSTARSIVTGHTLVSFAFNTIVIALLLTVLFLGR